MDPKRKRIYIILIISCVVLSAGILLWGQFGGESNVPISPVSTPDPIIANLTAPEAAVKKDSNGSYPAPVVFPANQTLDTSVLDFSSFKIFSSYQPVQVVPGELGRDDPFKSY